MNTYVVTNPATGVSGAPLPPATDAEVSDAVGAADRAHREFSRSTTVAQRAALMQRVADLHTERREHLAELIVRGMGKPVEQALGEVDFSASRQKGPAPSLHRQSLNDVCDVGKCGSGLRWSARRGAFGRGRVIRGAGNLSRILCERAG